MASGLESIVVDASPLAMLATDAHGMVTHWNAAAEGLFGWSRHEVLGRQVPFDPQGALQTKSGAFIEAAVWSGPILAAQGHACGTVIVAAGYVALRTAGLEFAAVANPAQ
jgi:hypothetical protein